MATDKWLIIAGSLFALLVLSFAWSTALTLLLGSSLNEMSPWAVYSFMASYGFSGRAGTLLWHSFLMAVIVSGGLAAAVLFIARPTWYGAARWATPGELRKAKLRADDGLVLGKKNGHLLRNAEPVHALVAAPTRSGKGVGVVIPNLLYWNGSVIVLDIKKENYNLTAGHRSKFHPVYMWSPLDECSARYNPFDFISQKGAARITDIQKLAQILLPRPDHGEKMWTNEAQSLFLGIALLVLDDPDMPSTFGQVYRILMADASLSKIADEALDNPDLDTACHEALANFKNKAEKERSGVKSSLTSALALWANPNIDAATSDSDFELREFRRARAAVYVGVGQDQLLTLAPLLNMFFQQAVAELSKSLPDADEKHEVLFLIDEFPMLGAMPTLQKGLALLAGYKIRIVLIIQGLAQLDELYGRQVRDGILQNCALQVFFASNDDATTNYVSERLGSKTVRVKSRSQSQDWTAASTSTSYIARPLLPPEEVRLLNPKQAIIFKETTRPVLVEKIRYYEERRFMKLLLDPPAVPELPARNLGAAEAERVTLKDAAGQVKELGGLIGEFDDEQQQRQAG